MKLRLSVFLLAMLALLQSSWLMADTGTVEPALISAQSTTLQACPAQLEQGRLDVAQVVQTDCCKSHKGVCGCRAGKLVCCDNTVSPTCTCHSDWHESN